MSKAYDVMTHALATCPPDASIAQVATIMRDRDIGDVLVVQDGKLCGIATDRDLAMQALTGQEDSRQSPIKHFMSTDVVTGEPGWSLEQVAKVMARHQIRRLPIVQDGLLAGIVSLADVARHENRKNVVTKSLRAVSTPSPNGSHARAMGPGAWIAFMLAALTAAMTAWLTLSRSGRIVGKTISEGEVYNTARNAAIMARDKVGQAAESKQVRNLRRQMRTEMKTLSEQLPVIQIKPPKHRLLLFS